MNPLPQPFKTVRPRVRRKRRSVMTPAPTPPAGPVLSMAYLEVDEGGAVLFLWFDGYDMSTDSFDPASITVNDPASGSTYRAVGADVTSGFIVQVAMTPAGPSSGTQTVLNAGAASGIVDADTGVPWAGAAELELPFP